mgnify:CR=1 FL=1
MTTSMPTPSPVDHGVAFDKVQLRFTEMYNQMLTLANQQRDALKDEFADTVDKIMANATSSDPIMPALKTVWDWAFDPAMLVMLSMIMVAG